MDSCAVELAPKAMSGSLQHLHRAFYIFFFDQQMVGFVGRDSQDADAGLRERDGQRDVYAGHGEIKGAFDLDTAPAALGLDLWRYVLLQAGDREFALCASQRNKIISQQGPVGNGAVGI